MTTTCLLGVGCGGGRGSVVVFEQKKTHTTDARKTLEAACRQAGRQAGRGEGMVYRLGDGGGSGSG